MTAPLTRPRQGSVTYARPMIELLPDESARCCCDLWPEFCGEAGMHITEDDYEMEGGVLL